MRPVVASVTIAMRPRRLPPSTTTDPSGPVSRMASSDSASLRRGLLMENLDLVFSYRFLYSRSNQDFADYDRHVFTLGLQYGF